MRVTTRSDVATPRIPYRCPFIEFRHGAPVYFSRVYLLLRIRKFFQFIVVFLTISRLIIIHRDYWYDSFFRLLIFFPLVKSYKSATLLRKVNNCAAIWNFFIRKYKLKSTCNNTERPRVAVNRTVYFSRVYLFLCIRKFVRFIAVSLFFSWLIIIHRNYWYYLIVRSLLIFFLARKSYRLFAPGNPLP